MVTVQVWLEARVAPQVVVERKGHSVVMRRIAPFWAEGAVWPLLRRGELQAVDLT